MPYSRRAALLSFALVPLCQGAALAAQAAPEELRALSKPSAAGVAANLPSPAGCPALPPPGPVIASRLIVRDTVRTDVGPYSVKLPGYATDAASSAHDSYVPYLIETKPGDTLRFDLYNLLDPNLGSPDGHTNLHTHGLIVAPRTDTPCGPPGDYVFVDEAAKGEVVGKQPPAPGLVRYRIDIPAQLPGQEFGTGVLPRPYPSGLQWFHAHLHGAAKNQVMAGEAGVLSVGGPLDSLDVPGMTAGQRDTLTRLRASTDVKYLALRDIQLAVPTGATPDKLDAFPPHPTATWLKDDNYDPGACSTPPPAPDAKGWCSHDGSAVAGDLNTTVWMFTVNGQLFPQITLPDRRNQVWRIANLSSNVTYVLELVDDSTGAQLPLHVLTIDGVVAGQPGGTDADEAPGVDLKTLLLMPASRAEVFVSNEARAERNLTLRTRGLQTGPKLDDQGNPVGDPWPALALAHVHWLPKAATVASAAPTGSWADVRSFRIPRPQAALSGDLSEAQMGAMLRKPAQSAPAQSAPAQSAPAQSAPAQSAPALGANTALLQAIPAGCEVLPLPSGGKSYRRRITFQEDNAAGAFKLGSDIVDQDGTADPAHHVPAIQFPHIMDGGQLMTWDAVMAALATELNNTDPTIHDPRHVCPRFGAQETWELVNETDETHNFHIHQSKFRLARPGDTGAPRDLVPSGSCAGPGTPVVCDPFPVLSDVFGAMAAPGVDVWHDTIPVPPRSKDGKTPGRVFVSIPFKAPSQIGRFVFHCHILEHEDGGMMAPVEVLHPLQVLAEATLPSGVAAARDSNGRPE